MCLQVADESSSEEELEVNPYQELLSSVSKNVSRGQAEDGDDDDGLCIYMQWFFILQSPVIVYDVI